MGLIAGDSGVRFWATKIGGPSHGFDVEAQCGSAAASVVVSRDAVLHISPRPGHLPLLANARSKVILVSDPSYPHHPVGRAELGIGLSFPTAHTDLDTSRHLDCMLVKVPISKCFGLRRTSHCFGWRRSTKTFVLMLTQARRFHTSLTLSTAQRLSSRVACLVLPG